MKILYVSTVSLTTIFFPEQMKKLVECGHTVEFACHIETEINPVYSELGIKFHNLPFSRSPFSRGNLLAYKQLKSLVEAEHYDIVHCHTPNASVIARLACRHVRKLGSKVIYTAHGFHFFKGAPLKNWLLFYPVEKFCARLTDVLITINQEDYSLAQHKMAAKKVCYVPGVGINLKRIDSVACDRAAIRKSIGVPEDCVLLFSVGELNVNKNHQVILKAMAKVNNPKVHYAIAGVGDRENALLQLAKELGLEKQFHLLGYRRDVFALDKAADIFCFPSHREGLSVSLMEAMACGLPAVCSKIRGNVDLIQQGKGGNLCAPTDGEAFADALAKLCEDAELRIRMGNFNKEYVKNFGVEKIVIQIADIYSPT